MTKIIKFLIDHIDPLGQGVSKISDKVSFISKTLPGERGIATIYKESKGVRFAHIETTKDLTTLSEVRQTPPCPHFKNCNGCSFLHTDYDSEMKFKEKSLLNMLKRVAPELSISSHPASNRLGYRNRVQLHYDIKQSKLGFINPVTKKIVEISDCKIANDCVKEKIKSLYQDNNWLKIAQAQQQKRGHVEIYQPLSSDNKVLTTWNSKYAHGGFTQINEAMNHSLKEKLHELINQEKDSQNIMLDLFGGAGNMSSGLSFEKILVADYSPFKNKIVNNQHFYQLDLYSNESLDILKNDALSNCDIIVDPPRSGIKNLPEFVEKFSPSNIYYISCSPQTMVRDILSISPRYRINETHLFDFFPSTHHFETFVHLKLNK